MSPTRAPHRRGEGKKELPRFLEKIVIDAGVGRQSTQPNFEEKTLPQIMRDLALLSGQKPEVRRARKSISSFKVREGQIVGLRVTLRRRKMVDFFNRLITIILPRIRDFNGIRRTAVDTHGALNIGVREQFVFPEVHPEHSPVSFSLGIAIVPRRRKREESLSLFVQAGVPLRKT